LMSAWAAYCSRPPVATGTVVVPMRRTPIIRANGPLGPMVRKVNVLRDRANGPCERTALTT
jgi:hypothetical protein